MALLCTSDVAVLINGELVTVDDLGLAFDGYNHVVENTPGKYW